MEKELKNTEELVCGTAGWLALVATPIGNLEDMTFRAVRILNEADLIAAEDTRRAGVLCNHFGIKTPRTAFHIHNEHAKTQVLLDRVKKGEKIAVVSDAGTPAICDPGFLIVREAIKNGIEPLVIPGVSALTFAVVAAGLPVDVFFFHGFAPVKSGRRMNFLQKLKETPGTHFFYETPHRIEKLLVAACEVLGDENPVAVVREATKLHEEVLRGRLGEVCRNNLGRSWKGEFVVAIAVS